MTRPLTRLLARLTRRTDTPVPVPPSVPPWVHRPPPATTRADRCGECEAPIPDRQPSLHFCSAQCAAKFNAALVAEPAAAPTPTRGATP